MIHELEMKQVNALNSNVETLKARLEVVKLQEIRDWPELLKEYASEGSPRGWSATTLVIRNLPDGLASQGEVVSWLDEVGHGRGYDFLLYVPKKTNPVVSQVASGAYVFVNYRSAHLAQAHSGEFGVFGAVRAIGDVRLQLHWEYLFVKFVIVARTHLGNVCPTATLLEQEIALARDEEATPAEHEEDHSDAQIEENTHSGDGQICPHHGASHCRHNAKNLSQYTIRPTSRGNVQRHLPTYLNLHMALTYTIRENLSYRRPTALKLRSRPKLYQAGDINFESGAPVHEGDYHYDEGTSACQNSAQPVPFCPETGGSPERSASPDAKEEQNEAEAPPSHHLRWVRRPNLSAQQRACRHELLLQKDEQGRAPFGLDDFPTDEAAGPKTNKGEVPVSADPFFSNENAHRYRADCFHALQHKAVDNGTTKVVLNVVISKLQGKQAWIHG
ncbi:unnamed protein product [Symbiodinium sp. KB8]|nr:unnamed protein product [Symbiodinium sp. KB8]